MISPDILHPAANLGCLVEMDAAIDRFHLATDPAMAGQADRTVDRTQLAGLRLLAQLNRAVDRAGLFHGGVVADVDRAIDRADVAGLLTGGHSHCAIDLADVIAMGGGQQWQAQAERGEHQDGGEPTHGNLLEGVSRLQMRRAGKRFDMTCGRGRI
jgi:hypothetical protein